MKNILSAILLAGFLLSCGTSTNRSEEPDATEMGNDKLVSYRFKVDGVQDEAIADSIFRLHFKIEGIDKMIISEKDCTVVFTVDPALLNYEGLRKAVVMQGGVVIEE